MNLLSTNLFPKLNGFEDWKLEDESGPEHEWLIYSSYFQDQKMEINILIEKHQCNFRLFSHGDLISSLTKDKRFLSVNEGSWLSSQMFLSGVLGLFTMFDIFYPSWKEIAKWKKNSNILQLEAEHYDASAKSLEEKKQ